MPRAEVDGAGGAGAFVGVPGLLVSPRSPDRKQKHYKVVNANASTLIARSPESVFDFVAVRFYDNYPRWSPEVQCLEVLSPGPIAVGSMARQVRVDQGRQTDSTFTVVAFEQPSRLEFADCGNQYRVGYRLEPLAGQTQLTFGIELIRLGLALRPFKKLIRAAMQDSAEQMVRNIKALLEMEVPG
jgi:hypothetical protein